MKRRKFIQLTSLLAGAVVVNACTKNIDVYHPNLTGSYTGSQNTGSQCTGSGSI